MVEYARVGSFASRNLAELAVTYLNANGIDATVMADDAGGQYPHITFGGRGIWLRVPAEDAEAARELFAQADAASASPSAASPFDAAPDAGLAPLGRQRLALWAVRVAVAAVVAIVVAAAFPRL